MAGMTPHSKMGVTQTPGPIPTILELLAGLQWGRDPTRPHLVRKLGTIWTCRGDVVEEILDRNTCDL